MAENKIGKISWKLCQVQMKTVTLDNKTFKKLVKSVVLLVKDLQVSFRLLQLKCGAEFMKSKWNLEV